MPTHSSIDGAERLFRGVQFVFLDRDGVINRKPPEGSYISKWSEFHLLPGAEDAIAKLNASGRTVIVITNQRGVALGLYSEDDVKALHCELQKHLAAKSARIDAFFYCPHDRGKCDCRKPGTALFKRAFATFPGAAPPNSIMIGDSLGDIEAAQRLSMPSIFVTGDLRYRKPGAEHASELASVTVESLAEAVAHFL